MSIIPEDPTFDELEKRVKKYLKYDKILGNFILVLFLLFLVPLCLGSLIARLVSVELTETWQALLIFSGFIPSYILFRLAQNKTEQYKVESDEWARFYTSSIYIHLGNYLNTRSSGMKKESKKRALKNIKDFLLCIEEKWRIGSLKPVKMYVGNSISDLKKNLQYRVIPAIKDGDDELLKKVNQIMYNFRVFSKNLTIKRIRFLNKQMSDRLPSQEPLKMGYFTKCSVFLKTHRILKHSLVISGFAVICVALGYVGVTCFSITNNYAWGGSIALFGILLATYFSRQPKIEK